MAFSSRRHFENFAGSSGIIEFFLVIAKVSFGFFSLELSGGGVLVSIGQFFESS